MGEARIVSIFIAPEEGAPIASLDQVRAVEGKGLEGDRYFKKAGTFSKKNDPAREVTLVELEAIRRLEESEGIRLDPSEARRNLLTEGIHLNTLVGREFRVGEATLRGIKLCHPCGLLERRTEPGVKKGLDNRGGLNAQIVSGGLIKVDDRIEEGDQA